MNWRRDDGPSDRAMRHQFGRIDAPVRGNEYKATNFGNDVEVPSIADIIAASGVGTLNVLRDQSIEFPRRLVVEADLLELAPERALGFDAGNWVLAMSVETQQEVAAAPGVVRIAPIVGRLKVGSGGAMHVTEIDAWDQSISIPAGVCRLEVGYGHVDPDFEALPGESYLIPDSIRIRATIQRGFSSSAATRRWMWSSDTNVQIPIPNFATCWRYFTTGGPIVGGRAIVRGAQSPLTPGTTGQILDEVEAGVLEAMGDTAASRRLPAGAETLQLVQASFKRGIVQFEIGGLG